MRFTKETILACVTLSFHAMFAGTSCKDGIAKAVWCGDNQSGQASLPVIDGSLSDWDRSAPVLCWNAEERAEQENATLYFMYNEDNLYIAYEMMLPGGRGPENRNRPQDRFWFGDVVQLRLCTDKSLGWPLPNRRSPALVKNPRITCVNLWRDTMAGVDYCHITPGAMFDCPASTNPEGTAVKTAFSDGRFTLECCVSWAALGVPNGQCPFSPGERMPAVVDVKWYPGSDGHYTPAVYRQDPGAFAFMHIEKWGRMEFQPKTENIKGVSVLDVSKVYAGIAQGARGLVKVDKSNWDRIAFHLPKRAKVSVNVFDKNGAVVRELLGGEWRDAGCVEVRWDGRDALGFPCEIGHDYHWGVYAHDGLDVVYEGTVGTSGEPPYNTPDGKGGWGADHGPPVACATDDTGRYFVWHMSEQGCSLVKTDFGGKVVWRSNPFVRGGWGEYTAACADGETLWLVHGKANGKDKAALVKIDGATGRHKLFAGDRSFAELMVNATATNLPPKSAARRELHFNCAGISVKDGKAYVSDRNGDRILIVDGESGDVIGEIAVEKPRGIAFAPNGDLFVVSGNRISKINSNVVSSAGRYTSTKNFKPQCYESRKNLYNPYAIAIGVDGTVYVSDLGDSQQIKVFTCGKSGAQTAVDSQVNVHLSRVFGKAGGRRYLGKIDYDAFLMPFGLAIDKTGALIVAEASAPKIVSILDAATGTVRRRYFGCTAYSPSNIPDSDDPYLQYCSLNIGDACGDAAFLRQKIGSDPDACWDFPGAGMGEFGPILSTMNMPEIIRCTNGLKYLAPDGTANHREQERPMVVCRVDGDAIRPVAGIFSDKPAKKGGPSSSFRLWIDADGDGRRQPEEFVAVTNVAGRTWRWYFLTGSMRMEPNGDLFLSTMDNAVVCFPCQGFNGCGAPLWNAAEAYIAIPAIVPGKKTLFFSYRDGLHGLRRDAAGNFYGPVNCNIDYATPELTKLMKLGMGHTSRFNGVFLCKWAPDGTPLWRVGRKATGSLRPGEMLHHWCFAGMVGDEYAVAASEWGVFTVYTSDGFFVDSLFDIPGIPGRGGPYSFGGEDFSGRIAAYPERGEVWAYNSGRMFKVKGFEKCRVSGEWRTNGVVRLNQVAPLQVPGANPKPLEKVLIKRAGGKIIFSAHVVDDNPLVNTAHDAIAVFKGGDAVGFEIGPGRNIGQKSKNAFTRILAARIGGKDRVIAMKPFTNGEKRLQRYTTPAGGTATFEFIGDVPGANVVFTKDADGKGYNVFIEVPEAFLELDFSKPVFWDAEVLFSGDAGRGVGTVRRVYLYNPETSQTSMVDDTPTEARLHPEGYAEVKL